MLTFALSEIAALDPEDGAEHRLLRPARRDAETNGMTLWMPAGAYIAATTDHEDVAKEFLAFIASVEGTEAQTATRRSGAARTSSRAPHCPTTCCRR